MTKFAFEKGLSGCIAGRWGLGVPFKKSLQKTKVLISKMGWVHPGGG